MKTFSIKKKHIIKIPKNIFLYYSEKNRHIFLKSPSGHCLIKLKLKLSIFPEKKYIFVTNQFFNTVPSSEKKRVKSYQGTYTSLIKKKLFEILNLNFLKLRLVGVGYKVSLVTKKRISLLKLSLGFSHDIYFKVPNDIKIICHKNNKIVILGNNYEKVTLIASKIRSYKIPEIYKGKGILYENEKLKLKEGKKV